MNYSRGLAKLAADDGDTQAKSLLRGADLNDSAAKRMLQNHLHQKYSDEALNGLRMKIEELERKLSLTQARLKATATNRPTKPAGTGMAQGLMALSDTAANELIRSACGGGESNEARTKIFAAYKSLPTGLQRLAFFQKYKAALNI